MPDFSELEAHEHLEHDNSSEWRNVLRDVVAGTVAGMAAKVVEYPFDTVKVRQQLEAGLGPIQCVRVTLQNEGVRGLFKGLSAPLFGAMAENAICFSAYEKTKRSLDSTGKYKVHTATPTSHIILAGSVSGLTVSFWLTPVEFVKVRLQSRHTGQMYSGPLQCIRMCLREEGMRAFYNGHSYTMARETIGGAFYFGAYELACQLLARHQGITKDDLSVPALMLAGGLGGTAYWSSIFPWDTIKSRIQAGTNVNTSMVRALLELHGREGLRGLYAGWGVTVLRAFPSNGVIFATYEVVSRMLKS